MNQVEHEEAARPDTDIAIELLYATPEQQELLSLRVPQGTTIQGAIDASGFARKYPEAVIEYGNVGIFSRKEPLDYQLQAGDRIEVYRPLQCDPKQVRRERARKQKGAAGKAADDR
ncbi:MAG: RnfH family protein [Xanthomonadales bacterium]|nr:RnfH family protein [Xanthomonadales bacterium]